MSRSAPLDGLRNFRGIRSGCFLLRTLKKGDVFMVTKVDRLGRNLRDIYDTVDTFSKRGVNVIILHGFGGKVIDMRNATDRIFLLLLAWFAEYEGERIAERTREGLAYRRNNGLSDGRRAFCYIQNYSPDGREINLASTRSRAGTSSETSPTPNGWASFANCSCSRRRSGPTARCFTPTARTRGSSTAPAASGGGARSTSTPAARTRTTSRRPSSRFAGWRSWASCPTSGINASWRSRATTRPAWGEVEVQGVAKAGGAGRPAGHGELGRGAMARMVCGKRGRGDYRCLVTNCFRRSPRDEDFQVWVATVDREKTPTAVAEGWSDTSGAEGSTRLVRQKVEYTNFPLPTLKLWLVDGVLMLPGEY